MRSTRGAAKHQPNPTVYTAIGPFIPFTANQILQFEMFYGMFDDTGATLFANLPEPNAQYTIELYDDSSGRFIMAITNSTTSGEISEDWGVTNSDGSSYTGDTVDAVFTVTFPDSGASLDGTFYTGGTADAFFSADAAGSGASGSRTQKINRRVTPVCDGGFLVYYANVGADWQDEEWFADERGVVDPLMQTSTTDFGLIANPYGSTYNVPDYDGTQGGGNPGLLDAWWDVPDFLANIGILVNRNFFWDGHALNGSLTSGEDKPAVNIPSGVVYAVLGNGVNMITGKIYQGHPYRFVFLNACDTADDPGWCETFGIPLRITEAMANKNGQVQGFLGWHGKPKCPSSDDDWDNIEQTYALFFYNWQRGQPLAICTNLAENPSLSWPLNIKFTPQELSNPNYPLIGGNNFNLVLWGYPGITRTSYKPGY